MFMSQSAQHHSFSSLSPILSRIRPRISIPWLPGEPRAPRWHTLVTRVRQQQESPNKTQFRIYTRYQERKKYTFCHNRPPTSAIGAKYWQILKLFDKHTAEGRECETYVCCLVSTEHTEAARGDGSTNMRVTVTWPIYYPRGLKGSCDNSTSLF